MASILFQFVRPDRQAITTNVTVTPLDTAIQHRGAVVTSAPLIVTPDLHGSLVLNIAPGRYRISDGYSRPYVIAVPDDDRVYLVDHLQTGVINRQSASPSTQQPNVRFSSGTLLFANTTSGGWHALRIAPGPGPMITIGADESDGAQGEPNVRFVGRVVQFYDETSDLWYTPHISNFESGLSIALQAPGTPGPEAAANWRLKPGLFQLLHRTTGQWHTVYVTGSGGALTLAIAAGETL